MTKSGFLIPLLALCSLNIATSEKYYITTTPMDWSCHGLCLTLSQFALNTSHLLYPNTTLIFLPGTHYLNTALILLNTDNLTMRSENSTAHIVCENHSNMYFNGLNNIQITNLEFIGCGGNQVMGATEFVVQDTKFIGQNYSETALELIDTTAQIVNTTFVSNMGSFKKCVQFSYPHYSCLSYAFIGGAIIATNSTVDISQSKFKNNRAWFGGAIYAQWQSSITMSGSLFINNSAWQDGGVLLVYSSTVMIEATEFHYNSANFGGVMYSSNSTITISTSVFHGNIGIWFGGVLESFISSTIMIETSKFHNNSAKWGGVLRSSNEVDVLMYHSSEELIYYTTGSTITIEASEFHGNTATTLYGGVLFSSSSTITIGDSNFTNNSSPVGAVIYAINSSKIHYNHLIIGNNFADKYAIIYLHNSEFKQRHNSGTFIYSGNLGSLVAFNSNITFISNAIFANNQSPKPTMNNVQEGGAMTLFQSNIHFVGACSLEYNQAENGGAIRSTESIIYVNGNVTLLHNTALRNGGGAYLLASELNCQKKSMFILLGNSAAEKGGGIHAISSSIKATSAFSWPQYTGTRMKFTNNSAKMGGGLSLEATTKLYILKYNCITYYDFFYHTHKLIGDTNTTVFTANSADYGGAVFVDDDSNSGSCTSDYERECFFQVLALYDDYQDFDWTKTQCIYFSQNHANISGSSLYGGLLNRCSVNHFAEVNTKYRGNKGDGLIYLKNVSIPTYEIVNESSKVEVTIPTNLSIASGPVRVCFCINNGHNHTHQSHIDVKKGEIFTKSLIAIDQIGQPVSATIQSSLSFTDSGLAEGQLARIIPARCTNLTFNIVSRYDFEILTLYASDGPCKDAELSRATVEVHFLPCSCPIGLQESLRMNDTNCTCECQEDISQYVEHCDSYTGSLIKRPPSRAWISYINNTGQAGYLVYLNCPFDYCLMTSPPVDLNQPNGADAQCAFNRSSLLCGSCRSGLSLSLGSSCCLPCPSYWPALLIAITIAAILAGIALVTLLLVLNATVAIGTLNGLIFYANVVYANKSILLPFQGTNFITVFMSWLNLELGIDTCYFPGMDTYIKTWLQLAFPTYIILLVVSVIIISSCSIKFSNLIGKKDPVATLATLLLLSYAKLLEICFKSLSFGVLEYPDGANELLWLPDATVRYLSGKHIPLFIAAVLILLVGLVYTVLLFSWQCFIRLPKWRIFKWSRNPRIQTFIETYHTPYTPKHRYWTGLLLIVRVVLYLIAAVVSNESTVALTAIAFSVCSIFLLKGTVERRLYRKWPLNVLESFFFFNILFLTLFTWYFIDKVSAHLSQEAIAYTSVTTTVAVLLLIILYHMYTYTNTFSKIKKTKVGRMIDQLSMDADPKLANKRLRHWSPPPDDDIHRFDELLDELDCPVNTNDYNTAPLLRTAQLEPTFSVVEVPKPCDLVLQNPA